MGKDNKNNNTKEEDMSEEVEDGFEFDNIDEGYQALSTTAMELLEYVKNICNDNANKKAFEERSEELKNLTNRMSVLYVLIEHLENNLLYDCFYSYVYPHKIQIEEMDEKFFLEEDKVFDVVEEHNKKNLPTKEINLIKDMWKTKGFFTDEEKNNLWDYFYSLLGIIEALIPLTNKE